MRKMRFDRGCEMDNGRVSLGGKIQQCGEEGQGDDGLGLQIGSFRITMLELG